MAQAKQFTLLLLYDKVASALPVAQALKEKEIEVIVVQNAAELIQSIATRKTDLVGLSVNHTSTTSLLRVLQDKTDIQIMVFGEDKHPNTAKKVDKANAHIKIAGIANGYNIFMKIGHLVKSKNKASETSSLIMLSGGGATQAPGTAKKVLKKKKQSTFMVRGKEKAKKTSLAEELANEEEQEQNVEETDVQAQAEAQTEDTAQEQFESQEEVAEAAPQAARASTKSKAADGGTMIFNDGVKSGGGTVVHKGGAKKPGGALLFKKKGEKAKGKSSPAVEEAAEEKGPGTVVTKSGPRPLGVGGTIVFSDEASASHKRFEKEDDPEVNLGTVKTPPKEVAVEKKKDNVIDFKSRKKEIEDRRTPEDIKKKYEQLRAERKAKDAAKPEPVAPIVRLRHKKQFKDAVFRAGEGFLKTSEGVAGFGAINKVSVVPVDNPREKGFLLVSSSQNKFLTPEQLETFKIKLAEEMKKDGSPEFNLGTIYDIETFDVDICGWAERYSQFYYRYEDEGTGEEVLISFLKRENVYPDHKKMEELGGVYRVHIHNMPPLVPLHFDVFLFLMKNNKLIPYLKKGGKFTARQIQRLYKRGFKFLYIPPEHKDAFLAFYISLSINQDFQSLNQAKLA